MNDIFSDMQSKLCLSYISDLPHHKQRIFMKMKRINLNVYPDRQLEDFSNYVFGISFTVLKDLLKKGMIEWKSK